MTKANSPLALVTGAGGRGIGFSVAKDLARRGFNLALMDINTEQADEIIDEVKSQGTNVQAKMFASDLSSVETHGDLVDEIVAWGGPITALVNNAGVSSPNRGDLLDITPETMDFVLGINLKGTFFLTQAVAKHMLAQGKVNTPRSIVIVSSVSAQMASIDRGEYCISKTALGMVTKLFALRLAEHGVGVFEVRPGITHTPMTDGVQDKFNQRIADGLVPMKRWGFPEDVSRPVADLASGELAFSTGSVMNVDGALSIQRF